MQKERTTYYTLAQEEFINVCVCVCVCEVLCLDNLIEYDLKYQE